MSNRDSQIATIAMLYPGALGAAIGAIFRTAGFRVITTRQGRSQRTLKLASDAGVEILPNLDEVVTQGDIVFSLVLPAVAEEVAQTYVERRHLRPPGAIYVDGNSTDAATVVRIANLMEQNEIPFVDGVFLGSASRFHEKGLLFVSGSAAATIRDTLHPAIRIQYLGSEHGQAKRLKLLFAGMSKGLVALFTDVAVIADRENMLRPLLEIYRDFYPGVMEAVERTLPTYPDHAERRAGELAALVSLAAQQNATAPAIEGVCQVVQRIANTHWHDSHKVWAARDVESIVHQLALASVVDSTPES